MSVNGALMRIDRDDLEWLRSDEIRGGSPGEDRTDAWFWSDNPKAFELYKYFSAVHFLLTGTAHEGDGPVSFLGNQSFGEEVSYEFAYGPGRVFDEAAVAAIASALEAVSSDTVVQRLNSCALAEVYPFALRGVSDEDRQELMSLLEELRAFMRAAARDRAMVLVAIL